MNKNKLTSYEKAVARACGISANDVISHGANDYGTEYSLLNGYFYIACTYSGYTRAQIYRDLLRRFIKRAEKSCGY